MHLILLTNCYPRSVLYTLNITHLNATRLGYPNKKWFCRKSTARGGMLFEKVLRRLCPCYYTRTDENELLCINPEEHKENAMENPRHTGRNAETAVGVRSMEDRIEGNESFSAVDYWGGSFDLVRPQPLYAFPADKIEYSVESKNLLRPPLYWKKTMKNFGSRGPPVVQELKSRKGCLSCERKEASVQICETLGGKQSEVSVDVRSVESDKNQVSWLTCKTHHDLPLDGCGNNEQFISRNDGERRKHGRGDVEEARRSDSKIGYSKCPGSVTRGVKNFRVFPDISYGVIVFSTAYHSRKKLLLLKIDRLENLSLKGRQGNAYSTIIKLSVSPSDKYVKSTKALKKSSSPDVKEDFTFKNAFNAVGHALLSLDDIKSRYPKKFRVKLYRHTKPHETPGNLALSVGYHPEEDKLTVLVDKGKNLSLQGEKNAKMNTYVKGSLYSHGRKLKSKKTRLVSNSSDPTYNSTFTFRVKEDDIDDLLIVVSVRLKSFLKDATIGRVILGPFFITEQKKLTPWGRVFLKHENVYHWFRLYL